MEIIVQNRDRYVYVEPQGRIDTITAPDFQKALEKAGETGAAYIINFISVPYISSAALRVVMGASKASGTAKGKLILCGMNEIVQKIFEISGFNHILVICEDLAAAEQLLSL